MIHEFARCPICGRGVLAIDDRVPAFVIDPHNNKGRPCPHLTLATVAFEAMAEGHAEQSGVWRWSRAEGLVGPDAEKVDLSDYLIDLACDSLPSPELMVEVPYELVGVYASERESARTGWGYFPVIAGKNVLTGMVNGWALYSHRPAELLRDIRRKLKLWTRLSIQTP